MKISRAIAVQSLTVCAGLILVAAVTVYAWGRYDKAQADAGHNSRSLQEFRLLEQATKSWLLYNDLIFASDQTLLISNTRRQGQLVFEKAERLRQTSLGQEAAEALATMAELVEANRAELSKLQYVTPDADDGGAPDPLDAWDQRAMAMAENLELARQQIQAASEVRAASLIGERNYLVKQCVIT